MNNTDMTAGRFETWARARKTFAFIQAAFAAGDQISISTYTRLVIYGPKHAGMFKVTRKGVYVQRGKSWDFISPFSNGVTRIPAGVKVTAGRR